MISTITQKSLTQKRPNPNEVKHRKKWMLKQTRRYCEFIQIYRTVLQQKEKKEKQRIYNRMAEYIGTRSTHQCRSHHQKVMKRFKSIDGFIEEFNKKYQPIPKPLRQQKKIQQFAPSQRIQQRQNNQEIIKKQQALKIQLINLQSLQGNLGLNQYKKLTQKQEEKLIIVQSQEQKQKLKQNHIPSTKIQESFQSNYQNFDNTHKELNQKPKFVESKNEQPNPQMHINIIVNNQNSDGFSGYNSRWDQYPMNFFNPIEGKSTFPLNTFIPHYSLNNNNIHYNKLSYPSNQYDFSKIHSQIKQKPQTQQKNQLYQKAKIQDIYNLQKQLPLNYTRIKQKMTKHDIKQHKQQKKTKKIKIITQKSIINVSEGQEYKAWIERTKAVEVPGSSDSEEIKRQMLEQVLMKILKKPGFLSEIISEVQNNNKVQKQNKIITLSKRQHEAKNDKNE